MKLPNLSQPVARNYFGEAKQQGVMPSVDSGCVISNCGFGALKCIPAYLAGGVAGAIACLGNAAPSCIRCFTG